MAIHHHMCMKCGFSEACANKNDIFGLCGRPTNPSSCDNCFHPWLYSLKDMALVLDYKIKIPHSIGECIECGKARLMQIKYKYENNEEPSREYLTYISDTMDAGVTRVTIDEVSYIWSQSKNQWVKEKLWESEKHDLSEIIIGVVQRLKG